MDDTKMDESKDDGGEDIDAKAFENDEAPIGDFAAAGREQFRAGAQRNL